MKRNNFKILIMLIPILILILGYILYNAHINEKEQYRSRNDFARASVAMLLSNNKEFELFYPALRIAQSKTTEHKFSEAELIYDFAQGDMIPILDFLLKENNSEDLINVFSELGYLMSDFYFLTLGVRENIFIRQSNGYYYTENDGVYTYYTRKQVITRTGFKNMYSNYLKSIKQTSALDNFANRLKQISKISKHYSLKEIKYLINHNYKDFYADYEDEIVKVIAEDLNDFCEFASWEYFWIEDPDRPGKRKLADKLKKPIDSEEIFINFHFTKFERYYSPISKYDNYDYLLDIEDLFNQIEALNYPKIYF